MKKTAHQVPSQNNKFIKLLIKEAMNGYDALTTASRLQLLIGIRQITDPTSQEHMAANQMGLLIERSEGEQFKWRADLVS